MSNVPSTQFYFTGTDAIKAFERFEVSPFSEADDSAPGFSVTGCDRRTGQRAVLADFPAQTNAETFRDMCVVVSLH